MAVSVGVALSREKRTLVSMRGCEKTREKREGGLARISSRRPKRRMLCWLYPFCVSACVCEEVRYSSSQYYGQTVKRKVKDRSLLQDGNDATTIPDPTPLHPFSPCHHLSGWCDCPPPPSSFLVDVNCTIERVCLCVRVVCSHV